MSTDSFRALVVEVDGDVASLASKERTASDLPDDGVLVHVEYTGANYKDALALEPKSRVVAQYPIVPGIDLAGVVEESDDPAFPVGTKVLAHGYDFGTKVPGGYSEYARVAPEQLVPLGDLGARDAMAIGTAGFTAAMSVAALQRYGVAPGSGPILVTGASGGVGLVSVDLLAGLGYEVVASTGNAETHGLLRDLGASDVIGRFPAADESIRALAKSTWAGAVDSVGGRTLASILSTLNYGAAVAASGLTGGSDLPTTVMPFILRGVALLGIDSVQLDIAARRDLWARLGGDLRPRGVAKWSREVALSDAEDTLRRLRSGGHFGRTVFRVTGAL